mmetsp:Transcript_4008/g.6114  ORF Transcript_4008/g.6114 Transcript_4008/m.6114 type:complete len:97 (-) Transcript_4008:247-537(-)
MHTLLPLELRARAAQAKRVPKTRTHKSKRVKSLNQKGRDKFYKKGDFSFDMKKIDESFVHILKQVDKIEDALTKERFLVMVNALEEEHSYLCNGDL